MHQLTTSNNIYQHHSTSNNIYQDPRLDKIHISSPDLLWQIIYPHLFLNSSSQCQAHGPAHSPALRHHRFYSGKLRGQSFNPSLEQPKICRRQVLYPNFEGEMFEAYQMSHCKMPAREWRIRNPYQKTTEKRFLLTVSVYISSQRVYLVNSFRLRVDFINPLVMFLQFTSFEKRLLSFTSWPWIWNSSRCHAWNHYSPS